MPVARPSRPTIHINDRSHLLSVADHFHTRCPTVHEVGLSALPEPTYITTSSSCVHSPSDIDDFLAGYPRQRDDLPSSSTPNVDFYKDEKPMLPDRLRYEEWMKRNENDFEELEANQ